ncbi:MAG: hypothetical protein AABX55_00975 [Nanoarchaeota archaeon]
MSQISQEKKEKIKEEILRVLYESYPEFMYTYNIADSIIRDNEFSLALLKELQKNNLIIHIEESKGNKVKRKWCLTNLAYNKYKELLS